MGLYEDQLNARKRSDQESFSEAIDAIADAVMGENVLRGLNKMETAHSAIEEVLKYYNFKAPKDELPENVKTVEDQIEYRMRPYGINFRKVTLDKDWYRQGVGAMIGTLKEDGSLVALIPSTFSGYTIVNLQTGKRERMNAKNDKIIEREAICFYQPLPAEELGVRDLIVFISKKINLSDVLLFVGIMIISSLVGLLAPLFSKWLFGVVILSESIKVLMAIAIFMIAYSFTKCSIDVFNNLVNARITTRINVTVEAAVMNRIFNLPASFFRDYSAGELSERAKYVKSLCYTIVTAVETTSLSAVFALVYISQMFSFTPSLVLPAVVIIVATLIVNMITIVVQIRVTRERLLRSAQTSGLTYATITGMSKVKLTGSEKRMFSRWAKQYASEASLLYNPPTFLKISGVINLAVNLIGTLIIYISAANANVAIADYYAFNTAFAMIAGAFGSLTMVISDIAEIKPILGMIEPILKTKPEFSQGKKQIDKIQGEIEIANVSFAYEEGTGNILDNLSLKIKPGEYVAIVGPTGCGKSTLIRLLLGFETPQKGAIYYDKYNMSTLDLKSLRKLIGTVNQDGKLFLGDVYSNIVIAAPQLTLDDAWEAAELACIADDIRKMPMGMNTMISEGQGGISGGQKQRLMIARALAPKPKILIFDEATSALDNITQSKVTKAIDSLNCTRIVIAHRLSTIKKADRIIYIDHGKVREEGTYDELININGYFSALVERQRLDIDQD